MAITSLVVIALFSLVAILGYLITPDHTPYCNQQYLELASLKPFSKATFLCIPFGAENGELVQEPVARVEETKCEAAPYEEALAGERKTENGHIAQ